MIDFVTIPSFGNAQDFGDMSSASYTYATASSKVRGFCAGGSNPHADVIDFITFSSTGNATDTGNLTQARYQLAGAEMRAFSWSRLFVHLRCGAPARGDSARAAGRGRERRAHKGPQREDDVVHAELLPDHRLLRDAFSGHVELYGG